MAKLLYSTNPKVLAQSIRCLGEIAGNDESDRDLVLKQRVISRILAIMKVEIRFQLLEWVNRAVNYAGFPRYNVHRGNADHVVCHLQLHQRFNP